MSDLPEQNFDPESLHPRGEHKWWSFLLTRQRMILLGCLVILCLIALAWPLVGKRWLPAKTVSAASTTISPSIETSPLPSDSPAPPTPTNTLTASPTLQVSIPATDTLPAQGQVVLSVQDGTHSHLFTYHAETQSLSRLSNGAWDDITPALSPDGNRVAFASNRNGYWNLYLLELASGELTQLTDNFSYEGAPSWSPDGLWLVYESYQDDPGRLDIFITAVDGDDSFQLTDHPAADYAPAWSPLGRQIAFVSSRSGEAEIWLADLDKTEEARFRNISQGPKTREAFPAWSPDGNWLAWSSEENAYRNLYVWKAGAEGQHFYRPAYVGNGDRPVWSPDGATLLTSLSAPNQTYLLTYQLDNSGLLLPARKLPGEVTGLSWGDASLPAQLMEASQVEPTPLWLPALTSLPDVPGGRQHIVPLQDVQAPQPYLHDLVDESFTALRYEIAHQCGWDFLYDLENAYIPLTGSLSPGLAEDWLYTGRAFTFSTASLQAGWLAVVREDYGPQTYWRVYVRAYHQDGSAGMPMHLAPWDFSARFNGSANDFEQGGALAASNPAGYWVDFSRLASAYGWERLPALSTWAASFPAARFNEFVHSGGLDWRSAMLELYPPDIFITPTPIVPPTRTPTPTSFWIPTPTITLTSTPRPTLTPIALASTQINPNPTRTPSPGTSEAVP